jgi:formamidopyrimidine-DNA glycosylase
MPELPEVETVRKSLEATIIGKTIESVEILWSKIIKLPEDPSEFAIRVSGQTIRKMGRRGKFLLFYLDTDVLVSHLRMEGKYGIHLESEPLGKHEHVLFHFSDGTDLRYKDVRKFGTMHLFAIGSEFDLPPLVDVGPEPFSGEYTFQHLKKSLKKTNRQIKPALLDQKIVTGLGNIYVDETLFRSGVHPERICSSLSDKEIRRIHEESVKTLFEAVEAGGSSVRSYVNSLGEIGLFQLQIQVYGRVGQPCVNCGTELKKFRVGGRGTTICPKCQKKK